MIACICFGAHTGSSWYQTCRGTLDSLDKGVKNYSGSNKSNHLIFLLSSFAMSRAVLLILVLVTEVAVSESWRSAVKSIWSSQRRPGQKSAVPWSSGTTRLILNSVTSYWNHWASSSSLWILTWWVPVSLITKTSRWATTLRLFLCLQSLQWDNNQRWVCLFKRNNSWSQLCGQAALALLQAIHPDRNNFDTKTVGFTYKLTRKYSKFIYIYYIPRQDSFLNATTSMGLFCCIFGKLITWYINYLIHVPLLMNIIWYLFLQLPLCCVIMGIFLDKPKGSFTIKQILNQ